MFPELNNVIGSNDGDLSGKHVLILEQGSDSSFILHHYLSAYIKQGFNVCLVLFNQSFSHYNSVGNKLSVNLANAKEQGNLVVIEGLKELGRAIISGPCNKENTSPSLVDFSAEKNSSLKPLFLQIKTVYDELRQSKPTLVIVDELSVLLDIGVSSSDIFFVMKYLGVLTSEDGALLAILHQGKDDYDAEILEKQLSHLSNVCIKVKGLQSGYCKDVHGEMAVTNIKADSSSKNVPKRMQFRIMDKGVSFFAVGTSGAVL